MLIYLTGSALGVVNSFAKEIGLEAHEAGVNRTVPQAQPFKASLEFSVNPTSDDIFRAHIFQEPLVVVGSGPSSGENAALAAALRHYANRSGPDDFSALTAFLKQYPNSSWTAALSTDLGFEYFNTAHYSLALEAWRNAWTMESNATNRKAEAMVNTAFGELAYMYARLGRMTELEALLKSVEGRMFIGSATEKIAGAREGLWNMQNRPEIAFRCGPLALHRIKLVTDPEHPATMEILNSVSTQQGMSLTQVAELSKRVGLNYQMAFRKPGATFIVPSVVHWKVGHYAAMVRQEGDRYLLEDPTFGNHVWASRAALEAETSGYFLVSPKALPTGWRIVSEAEGAKVWGKGQTGNNDSKCTTPNDPHTPVQPCSFAQPPMAVPSILLMLVSVTLVDAPAGYSPPVGPSVEFTVRYNHREASQPANFTYSNFGPKWTCDWISYITDNPSNPSADVFYYARGGGTRSFPGFSGDAYEKYDQTRLLRLSANSYELISRDGSKLVFSQSDGSTSSTRKIFLSYVVDPCGNYVALTYDSNLRITGITDTIGQNTTLTYGLGGDIYKITKVTDPFGRFATFDYDGNGRLSKITDVIGLTSQFTYLGGGDFVTSLTTPYGTTQFTSADSGNTRVVEILYPDSSRERVEYNQAVTNTPMTLPVGRIPAGMATLNNYLGYRNTYYWSRAASAIGYGDYTRARLYHWLHTEDFASTAGALESTKEPLEGRVWRDYSGQSTPIVIGKNNCPTHVGRVLDDGTSQVYTYAYDDFGHVTSSVDPAGRRFSYIYSTNGIDLTEVRQTRAGKNELLSKATYNAQHQPLTTTDAAGQTTSFTYNSRGQILSRTNPKNETITFNYDFNGYLTSVDGALPGASDTVTTTYDGFGRRRTVKDVSGYVVTMDYDAADRIVKVTFPDGSFNQNTYDRLDVSITQDRAGRQTVMEHDRMRQLTKVTDPLGRATTFEWCSCGDPKSMTDPMGRTTLWTKDIQGRHTGKTFGDGSQIRYVYEPSTSRLMQAIDQNHQTTQYAYNRDDTLKSVSYLNSTIPTPPVSYTYDTDYPRPTSVTDSAGTTVYSYFAITATPSLGAGRLASIDGPLPNDTVTYGYDELGREVRRSINGVGTSVTYDAARRLVSETNALGAFSFGYAGSSARLVSQSDPNGQTMDISYGNNLQDFALQQITFVTGATPVSQFSYNRDIHRRQTTNWSQQAGAQSPSVFTFGYDAVDQLLSAAVTNSGAAVINFAYSYDLSGNRLTEQTGPSNHFASYNALNQIATTTTTASASRSNEWDAVDRLVAVNVGNQRTEFTYNGFGRMTGIRKLVNGSEVSHRLFVWSGEHICEERDASGGTITKRYFPEGMRIETGPATGSYYYTRDHLGSIRELTDSSGNVRARYAYDPFGRRTKLTGDVDADFGFAGMFWASEASLSLTHFRAYDPELGRWLSRDPLKNAEFIEGPNLYVYAGNDPVNKTDPLGLLWWADLTVWGYHKLAWGTKDDNEYDSVGDIFGFLLDSETLLGPTLDKFTETAELKIVPLIEGPKLTYPGVAGPFSLLVGAGVTILTMTDCNTVNGILGLVRQGKGGSLNIYEDRLLKQLDQNP